MSSTAVIVCSCIPSARPLSMLPYGSRPRCWHLVALYHRKGESQKGRRPTSCLSCWLCTERAGPACQSLLHLRPLASGPASPWRPTTLTQPHHQFMHAAGFVWVVLLLLVSGPLRRGDAQQPPCTAHAAVRAGSGHGMWLGKPPCIVVHAREMRGRRSAPSALHRARSDWCSSPTSTR